MPALKSVESVFAEAECSCARCGKRIDHTHLDQIEFFVRTRKPAPGVVHMELQVRQSGHIAVSLIERILRKQIHEDGIEFYARNVGYAEEMGRHKVAPAAHADHRGFVDTGKPIRETYQIVLQERDRISRAIV